MIVASDLKLVNILFSSDIVGGFCCFLCDYSNSWLDSVNSSSKRQASVKVIQVLGFHVLFEVEIF